MTRILYVEDNDDNVYMLQLRMDDVPGYELLTAGNGEEALAIAEAQMPDLILMDLNLPVMNGWEAAGRLKANPKTRHIPIIALTANAMTGDRDKALASGCDDFDTKPIEFDRLLGKISSYLNRR